MHTVRALFFLLLACSGAPPSILAQSYFKQPVRPGKYTEQRIARFPDGDVLVGTSSLEAQLLGTNGQIYLTRLDPCGVVRWSFSYERAQEYIELRDVLINEAGEVFAYGSAYRNLDERLFLLKVSPQGALIRFNLFQPETVDHFTFSLDLRDGQLLAYGLLLGWNTQKQGFVAVFNEGLNYRWGKKFSLPESDGAARFTADGSILCRSGPYLLKLRPNGTRDWGTDLTQGSGLNQIAGPVEVEGGQVIGVHRDDRSFLYQIDDRGRVQWQSPWFPATRRSLDLSVGDDGRIRATFLDPTSGEQRLSSLLLSARGEILDQRRLQFASSFQSRSVQQLPGGSGSLTLAGNRDRFGNNPDKAGTFLMQVDPQTAGDCFAWEAVAVTQPNTLVLAGQAFEPELLDLRLEAVQDPGSVAVEEYLWEMEERCEPAPDGNLVRVDTLLDCGEEWRVTLPDAGFRWLDGYPDSTRLLSQPGAYEARNQSCISPVTYIYRLEKEPCATCPVFLPNAISPNGDGRNDELEFFADCPVLEVHCRVFNRQGALVFESKDPDRLWDGSYGGRPAPGGVYVALVRYTWLADDGAEREEKLAQDVLLLR